MDLSYISKNIEKILKEIPDYVKLVAVVKNRTIDEIKECVNSGVKLLGINYVQEAEKIFSYFKESTEFHMIGHLQKNKINKAIKIFDMIQSIDSFETVLEINKRLMNSGRKMPILVEVNIAKEESKKGIHPENLAHFIDQISNFDKIEIMGIMTIGPKTENLELKRKYFKMARALYEDLLRLNIKNSNIKYLSMGMSDDYKIAIDEGSNMIRIGRKIFSK